MWDDDVIWDAPHSPKMCKETGSLEESVAQLKTIGHVHSQSNMFIQLMEVHNIWHSTELVQTTMLCISHHYYWNSFSSVPGDSKLPGYIPVLRFRSEMQIHIKHLIYFRTHVLKVCWIVIWCVQKVYLGCKSIYNIHLLYLIEATGLSQPSDSWLFCKIIYWMSEFSCICIYVDHRTFIFPISAEALHPWNCIHTVVLFSHI